ncbi:unnamed protein product [Ectocarpus sp. CCAP 1310/34]|nr:unnamed protein product [Ectocarpus sp. CCAP 1310/34]
MIKFYSRPPLNVRQAVLFPSKEEIYPTAALWASCFYSSNDCKMHRKENEDEQEKEGEQDKEKEDEHQQHQQHHRHHQHQHHQHQHQHQPNESPKAARGAGDCLDQPDIKKLEQGEAGGEGEEGGAASHGISDCAGQTEKRSPVEAEASPHHPIVARQEKGGGGGGGGDAKGDRKLAGIIISSLKKWFRELVPHGLHRGGGVNVHID